MQDLIKARAEHLAKAEEVCSQQHALVRRVLNVFASIEKELYSGYSYDLEGPRYGILQGWNWPQVFDTFEIEEDGVTLYAGGMYSGSYGYYEHESIRFPVAWLSLSDESLIAAIRAAWEAHKLLQRQKREDAMVARQEKERQEYARLREKYGEIIFSKKTLDTHTNRT